MMLALYGIQLLKISGITKQSDEIENNFITLLIWLLMVYTITK